MISTSVLNGAWMWLCRREGTAFRAAHADVAGTQRAVLRRILAANASSTWGTRYGFAQIDDPTAFQRSVPVTDYETLRPSIERIAAGASHELTAEPVRWFERTSGTTHGQKLIPYTARLSREIQRGLAAWIWDLFSRRPRVRRGRAYWSISPAFPTEAPRQGAVPIGVADDTAYLNPIQRIVAKRVLAVPPTIARVQPLEAFRYVTLLRLLAAEDLALVSIWSPTFLTTLLAGLNAWQDRLIHDLRRGTLSPPGDTPMAWALPPLPADPARADTLEATFRSGGSATPLTRVWPRLALISCWADAAAAWYLPPLRSHFPNVEVQPKGLIATEGIVSLPLVDHAGGALAVRSHFFEFEPSGESKGRPRLAHELECDACYRVLLTTGGGLYRYPLGDEVQVVGFANGCPLMRLIGRSLATSDLVGEKLHESHVHDVLERLLAGCGTPAVFRMLAPVAGEPPRYRLFLQLSDAAPPSRELQVALETGLSENPHYAYAVELGQLGPAEVQVLDASAGSAWETYERRCFERGLRAGDIKPVALDRWTGWVDAFPR